MKLDYPKDWYENRIALGGDEEVGVGSPPGHRADSLAKLMVTSADTRIAFGTFVNLWRRNQGWNAAKLAETAGLDADEVREIERDSNFEPEMDTVYKLAIVFGLSPKPLLELAGATRLVVPELREEAVRSSVGSEPVAALNEHEREALESFMSAISETATDSR